MITRFEQILETVKHSKYQSIVSIAFPYNPDILEMIVHAKQMGIANFILIGEKEKIQDIGSSISGFQISDYEIIFERDEKEALLRSINLVREGKANISAKGSVHTGSFLKAILDKEKGLRTGKILSHVTVIEVESYPKLILMSDAAVNIMPDLERKLSIIKNSIDLAKALQIQKPNIALLSAEETVNPEMLGSLDAKKIVELAAKGEFGSNVTIEGPLALDVALSEKAANIKKIKSNIAGKTDIFIVPDIVSGNIFYKSAVYLAKAKMAGIVLGAKVPLVVTSRSDTAETRLYSIALSGLYQQYLQQNQ